VAKSLLGMSLGRQLMWRSNCFLKHILFFLCWRVATYKISVQEMLRTELGVQFGGETLRGETKERWRELCERAVIEQDPNRFVATIQELIQELEEKEERRRAACSPQW
jgi:hypothetical protein